MTPVDTARHPSLRIGWSLVLIILVAFGLFCFHLDGPSLWYDESFGIHLAHLPLTEAIQRMANTFNPPLYYLLLRMWIPAAGSSEFAVRMVSVYAGLVILPLGYSLGRRLFGRTTGLIVMVFFAVSPLYVWHAQNARMYTLMTGINLAAIWCLTKILDELSLPDDESKNSRWWQLWGICLICLLFTHTVAVYSVVAQMLILAFFGWRRGRRGVLGREVAVGLILVMVCAPWLWLVSREYKVDFYPGTLSPATVLISAFKSFATGDVFPEPTASFASAVILAILVLAILTLINSQENGTSAGAMDPVSSGLFLLFLTVIPLLLMALALYRIPKFTPRYTIAASSTMLLLLAAGLSGWFSKRRWIFAIGGLMVILGIFVAGTRLIFADPRLSKDDFRAAADYVGSEISADETVLLLSGHAFPVWDYYYSGEYSPIPQLEVIDLNQTVDYSVADALNRALETKRGAWVVLWQEEIIDPNGFVQMMLDQAGRNLSPVAEFHGVELWHYRWEAPPRFSDQPNIANPLDIGFGSLRLLGYTQDSDTVMLFWKATSKLDDHFKIALRLYDGQSVWGELDNWPSSYLYPTSFWKPNEVLFGRHTIPINPGTPPGQYLLGLSVYEENDLRAVRAVDGVGQDMGVWVPLPVVLTQTWVSQDMPDELEDRLAINMNGDLMLLAHDLNSSGVSTGGSMEVELYWQARRAPATNYLVRLGWSTVEQNKTVSEVVYPLAMQYPTSIWQEHEFVLGRYRLPPPPAFGSFDLQVQLLDAEGVVASDPQTLQTVIVPSME